MKIEYSETGNLILLAEPEDRDMLEDLKTRNGGNDLGFMCDLLEETGWSPNGRLMTLNPEDIAALTDAPIVTDDRTIEDDGSVTVAGKVWWYPDYMVRNFADDLLESGKTVFQLAPAA